VGVYRGEETETTFRLRDGDRETGHAWLAPGVTRLARRGDITTVVPPEDIHQVSNRGGETAVSIHLYGTDIGTKSRHSFDLERGTVTSFVSGYDQPLAPA
jgi:predicted metal-dependent enzyme (double-stranded beta helix superfamily)